MPLLWMILLRIDHFSDCRFSFMTADTALYRIELFFESNRYRIEIGSYRMVSATSRSKIESNRNRFDLTALVSIVDRGAFAMQ
jgi:hypothetical protein